METEINKTRIVPPKTLSVANSPPITCSACGSLAIEEHRYPGLLHCRQCTHVFAKTDLSEEEFKKLYGEDYFHGQEYSNYIRDQNNIEKNFGARLKTLVKVLGGLKGKSAFEIGSAYGFFLNVAKNHFDEVEGIDITEPGTRFAREHLGLNVHCGDFLSTEISRRDYDLVCAWDTIEHLPHPERFIAKAARIVKPGGAIALTTGDIGSWNARFRGKQWRLIHPPTHVHYFTLTSMKAMLERYGFELIHQEHCGFYRSVDQAVCSIVALKMGKPGLYQAIKKTGITNFDFYLNLYDIMYVIARKKPV